MVAAWRRSSKWRGCAQVIPGVFRLGIGGSGAFLLLDDRVTIIDSGHRWAGGKVLKVLDRLGRAPEDISYIVSTHYHHDHIGGVAHLRQNSHGRVALHEAELGAAQRDNGERLPNPFQNSLIAALMTPLLSLAQPPPFPVDLPLQDGHTLEPLGGMQIIHSPGHTPGSISLHFPKAGLLIAGDALECRRGRLGLPSRLFTADMEQAKESIRRLARLDFDVLCLSHFPPIDRDASRALRRFAESLD